MMALLTLTLCWMAQAVWAAGPVYMAPPTAADDPANAADLADPSAPRDGSQARPFLNLAQAVQAVSQGQGDHVALLPGQYGAVTWKNIAPLRMIEVRPASAAVLQNGLQAGDLVHFDQILLENTHNLAFSGLAVWPRQKVQRPGTLVTAHASSSHLSFDQMDLRGRADAPQTYMRWSARDWLSRWRNNGFLLSGPHMRVANSTVTGVAFGITTHGAHAEIRNNLVRGFSGDGLRALGNHSRVTHNRVQDCFEVDKNHHDGFQAWSPRHEGAQAALVGLQIEHNQIWEWTGRRGHPLRCQLQGVGLFDGHYRDIVIRNNLVVVDHYHGISLYGGINGVISHNTVVHASGHPSKLPWISVKPHKNGSPSRNIEVSGNLAMAYKSVPHALAQNAVARFPAQLFQNPVAGDFRPRSDAPFQQIGAEIAAPVRNHTGLPALP